MSGASITAEPSAPGAPPSPSQAVTGGATRSPSGFLAPTIFFLGLWIVYPAIRTFIRSFFEPHG